MFEATTQVLIYRILLATAVIFTAIYLLLRQKYIRNKFIADFGMFSLLLFCIFFIGYREWWNEDVFVDSVRYGGFYIEYLAGKIIDSEEARDIGFEIMTQTCANLGLSIDLYFLICAFLYVFPLYLVSYKLSQNNFIAFFMMLITAMSFYGYGVNGIRNGIATSLLLLAMVNYKRTLYALILSVIAISFHKSVVLPFLSLICVICYTNIRFYLKIWLMAIPLSFVINKLFTDILLSISFIADRAEGYLTGEADSSMFSSTGFRIDFLLYSSVPILIGYYFILRKSFTNKLYEVLLCSYMLSNSVWILLNQVPFSNRFAYLSWFIMPILIIYPFVSVEWLPYRYSKISLIIFLHFAFTLCV